MQVEGDKQDGAVHAVDVEVDDVGQDVVAPAVEVEAGVALDEPVMDGIGQAAPPGRGRPVRPPEFGSLAESGNGGDILRARPQAVFPGPP